MVVGVDEVGRGCWAGPLVAGAVALASPIAGLADSKALTKIAREKLAAQICTEAVAIGLGWVTVEELDEVGLTEAVRLAMQRAVEQISVAFDELIVDGNINYFPTDARSRAIIKADATIPSVSAASILAKVARDKWMAVEAVRMFPDYHFDKHVGYGTMLHRDMLIKHGVCSLHRRSFKPVKAMLGAKA
jgi:ribonuclease HII